MFESFTPAQSSWKRRTLFIGSIVFHGAAAIALLIWSVLHVEELPPPEVTLTFFNAPPPPPPPPPPAGGKKKPSTKPKIVVAKITNNPHPQPKDPDPAPEHESKGGEAGGVVGGVAGGVLGGIVGSPLSSTPAPAPAAPAAPKMVPSFIFDKERLSSPDPHLPDSFKDKHPKSSVTGTYRLCVGTDGRITEVAVVHPIGGIDDDLLRQIRSTWVYKPQPLPVCSVRNFVFKIN